MKVYNEQPALAARRKAALLALTAFIMFIGVFVLIGPAWSMELDHPSSVINTDETLPILSSPSPVQTDNDSCLALLKSVRHTPSSAMDRDRQNAGKAAALGLVFGVRFALGPKEVTRPGRKKDTVRFDVWQPSDQSGVQALAIADYRRCKNEQALKAISDWRWKR